MSCLSYLDFNVCGLNVPRLEENLGQLGLKLRGLAVNLKKTSMVNLKKTSMVKPSKEKGRFNLEDAEHRTPPPTPSQFFYPNPQNLKKLVKGKNGQTYLF